MKQITFTVAKPLDGSTPYMGLAFIDSYGDVLLKELTLDDALQPLENYFTPCNYCGLPVVDSSIMPDTQGMCDHCYKAGPKLIEGDTMQGFANMEDRIGSAVYMASTEFWKTIADLFPECKTGDLEPNYAFKMEETMKETVTHWVENNKPEIESWAKGLNLHYATDWRMKHTVACIRNVMVDCGVVIVSDEKTGTELDRWNFNDNPTVLMNILEQYFGSRAWYNLNWLFDDIFTVSKSGHVS